MPPRSDPSDPRGLIHEAYEIDGIGMPECRSIFLDWAIGIHDGESHQARAGELHSRFRDRYPDHPMTEVLRAAAEDAVSPGRRGGARGRRERDQEI